MAPLFHNPFRKNVSAGSRMDGATRALAAVAFVPLLIQWAFIVGFVVPRLGSLHFLRMHYDARGGVDWVDVWYAIFLYPAIGLAAFAVNLALAIHLAKRDQRLSRALLVATAFIEVLLAAGGVIVVLLNG